MYLGTQPTRLALRTCAGLATRGNPEQSHQLEALPHQFRPVSDRTREISDVDVVEFGRVDPLFFQVIDFELDIGRDQVWLYGTDVVSKDLC
jgi:hypothetical protein